MIVMMRCDFLLCVLSFPLCICIFIIIVLHVPITFVLHVCTQVAAQELYLMRLMIPVVDPCVLVQLSAYFVCLYFGGLVFNVMAQICVC
jgi:hypothetical protein